MKLILTLIADDGRNYSAECAPTDDVGLAVVNLVTQEVSGRPPVNATPVPDPEPPPPPLPQTDPKASELEPEPKTAKKPVLRVENHKKAVKKGR